MYVSTISVIENKHVIPVFTTNHTSHYKQKKSLYATFIPVNSIIFTCCIGNRRQAGLKHRTAGSVRPLENEKTASAACPPAAVQTVPDGCFPPLFHQHSRNDELLYFLRSFIDLSDFCIAHKALDRIILCIAVSAEYLHGLRRHFHSRIPCI